MKRILFSIIALMTLSLAGCDKIDQEEYIVYAGATGTWYDDLETLAPTQRALVEKYTGVRCKNCPTADEVIHEAQQRYGERLIAVAIHPKGSNYTIPYTGERDLATEVGQEWNDYYNFSAYPQAIISRKGESFVPTTNFDGRVDEVVTATPKMGIAVECERVSGEDSLVITVHLSFLSQVSEELNLTLVLTEDGIVTTQKMPDGSDAANYVQNHVLRDVITDTWGTPVDKGTTNGESGSRRMATFTYLPLGDCQLEHCHIVAFVSNSATKEILNVAECTIRL